MGNSTNQTESDALKLDGTKQPQGGSWFGDYQAQKKELLDGTKCGGDWFNDSQPSLARKLMACIVVRFVVRFGWNLLN